MSDDEADPEFLELLRQSLGIKPTNPDEIPFETGVLRDAEFIYANSVDVSIDMVGTKTAARTIYALMQARGYSTQTWSTHSLHPTRLDGFSDLEIVNFVFTMDLLNFSFWSELSDEARYQVEYRGSRWTGYNSLVASLRRALDAGVPITTPRFWTSAEATDENLGLVFFGATNEKIPLLKERIDMLREAGRVLHENFGEPECDLESDVVAESQDFDDVKEATAEETNGASTISRSDREDDPVSVPNVESIPVEETQSCTEPGPSLNEDEQPINTNDDETNDSTTKSTSEESTTEPKSPSEPSAPSTLPPKPDFSIIRLIKKADHSAGKLANLLAKHFAGFRDEARFDNRKVRILKRAQIFVADLWAAFKGQGYGEFHDIDQLTMFADYRIPQMLHSLGVLNYSPTLAYHIKDQKLLPSGHSWEIQLRGCSIWAVELIQREIKQSHPKTAGRVNAVLIDFFLYDLAKEREYGADGGLAMGHHRTRSIWY
ncbi:Hypothetical protein R9X50_00751700 [Acrodontium crateriforme]|uniref:Queuosine 5'-phosphate N-glycosylase/hydrolase n=1 Tax=Acrodontium crateriforme TaxID=150365 RepID=A0AAQ3MAA1_9PEZI|nr:Hypothetical protein R9X50_00751700 [Acrodontium crateriforme]